MTQHMRISTDFMDVEFELGAAKKALADVVDATRLVRAISSAGSVSEINFTTPHLTLKVQDPVFNAENFTFDDLEIDLNRTVAQLRNIVSEVTNANDAIDETAPLQSTQPLSPSLGWGNVDEEETQPPDDDLDAAPVSTPNNPSKKRQRDDQAQLNLARYEPSRRHD